MENPIDQGGVNVSIENSIASIEFHHPLSNSLPGKVLQELANTITELGTNDEIIVIILKSAGERAFCAGASFDELMSIDYDATELAAAADEKIRTFQADGARDAGIFHHLITLPTYHTAALSTDNLAKGYFGSEGMLAYVAGVQRKELREGLACVKHQAMAGSNIGDDHKEYFSGDQALKASGKDNTMNQFD